MISIPPVFIAIGGLTIFTLLVVQILIGLRKIKFKGALHLKVHKAMAWTILGLAALHGLGGMILVGIIRL